MRILLADDESNVRYGLRVLPEERTEFEVVGEAADANVLLAQLQAACPDLLLLPWLQEQMPLSARWSRRNGCWRPSRPLATASDGRKTRRPENDH